METLLLEIALLVGGFLLLGKGADWLVDGSTAVARGWGVRPLVVGLTIVAWGTSAPEVVVSLLAAVEGKPAISLGNVLGSNVANIGLVLGACGLVLPEVMQRPMALRESFWILLAVVVFWWTAADHELDRMDGAVLLGTFAAYNAHLVLGARGGASVPIGEPGGGSRHRWRDVLLGSVAIAVGAKLVVMAAESIALRAGISERVIGLTIVAIGTSLPELAAGLGGAFKKQSEISLGNVVGSNVFNVLAVIGLVAVWAPFGGAGSPSESAIESSLGVDFPLVLAFSIAAVALPWVGGERGGRWKGLLLLGSYAAYIRLLFAPGAGGA